MMDNQKTRSGENLEAVAEAVRQACIKAAKEGFTDASTNGLCEDGAVEAAIGAMQKLDIRSLIQEMGS